MQTPVNVNVISYSATGGVFQPAKATATATATEADQAGARVRLRKVGGLVPEEAVR